MRLRPPEDHHLAYTEDSHLEPTVDFDYGEVAKELREAVTDEDPAQALTEEEWRKLQGGLEGVIRWIYQDPLHRNMDGIAIRGLIVAWIVVKELQPLNLTELSRMYGKDKQSLGRWVEDFKKRFPGVRNCHMKDKP
jgi:hypothetical protein